MVAISFELVVVLLLEADSLASVGASAGTGWVSNVLGALLVVLAITFVGAVFSAQALLAIFGHDCAGMLSENPLILTSIFSNRPCFRRLPSTSMTAYSEYCLIGDLLTYGLA